VDVTVLPPVSTADWTVRDLRERIEEIRIGVRESARRMACRRTAP